MGLMDQFVNMTPQKKQDLALSLAESFAGMSGNPNAAAIAQGIAAQRAGIMQRRQAAAAKDKATQITNETVKWLMGKGKPDLAKAVASGIMPATDAVKEAMGAPAERKTSMGPRGQLRYVDTGEVVPGFEVAEGAYTDKQLGTINALRDDVRADMKDFGLVQDGWNRISTFYNNPGAVSDYALAVGFAKILDPGSVAREGEVAAVNKSGSIAAATKEAIVNAIQGKGSMPAEIRQEIAQLSRSMYADQAKSAQDKLGKYKETANRMKINFSDIYYGGDVTMPGEIVPAVVPPAVKQQGVTQADWDLMTTQQRKDFLAG